MKVLINQMQVKTTYDSNNFFRLDGRIINKESIQGVILTIEEYEELIGKVQEKKILKNKK